MKQRDSQYEEKQVLQFARLPCWVWVISLNEKWRAECDWVYFQLRAEKYHLSRSMGGR